MLVLVMLSLITSSTAQNTIADLIRQRSELSMIRKFMEGTDTWNKLALTRSSVKYTFFAPHNRAFMNVSEQVRATFNNPQLSTDYANLVFSYHTVLREWRTSEVTGNVQRMQSLAIGAKKLFLVRAAGEVFINGARFIEADIDVASNGILHIIDRIFLERTLTSNAYNFITQDSTAESTIQFKRLMDTYVDSVSRGSIRPPPGRNIRDNLLNNDRQFVTVFVPTDIAANRITAYEQERYIALRQGMDPHLLQKVIESHVIPDKPYHSNILETLSLRNEPTPAVQGKIRVYRHNGALFVSHNCVQANVTKANITATNGVVYIVDTLFGFIYNDIYTQMKRDMASLYEFSGTIDAAPADVGDLLRVPGEMMSDIPDDQKLTIFAPINSAFRGNDFAQDSATKAMQIHHHVVSGVVEVLQMTNGTIMPTLRPDYSVRFYQFGDSRYVEVNYVRAKVVGSGDCVKNGIVHKVDQILGVPGRSIYKEIEHNANLRSLFSVIRNTNLPTMLDDLTLQMSMFAPIDFSKMRRTDLGISLLDDRMYASRLRNLLRRHIAKGYVFLDETLNTASLETYYDPLSIIKDQDGEYYLLIGTKRIRVVRPNMRMKNGVVHIIEEVVFDPTDPNTGQSISRASRFPDSLSVIALSVSSMFVFFRHIFLRI